ncbi:MAG: cation diffusion facilitator family transporter [Saprospiraceae bacterium]|nr:cation diffusion facilitator family transporter [Saprospiraceae bacterium]MCF8251374.1 cation diffusion facilitator family transporter [Saprospiraceae bacterium]MCF8280549.1 cation diffusion facilitator family transporter [Bacteroidales bacterium]MCF8313233.1 cation diffusion facilitator family transporter [Saprospiraceae bacterium]MCF8441680.1 cation diffusion facilitator family transporter [Saprospiraceae bacterium]
MTTAKENINVQRLVVAVGLALFAIKVVAWYMTSSVAILTDALESTVNVVASFIGLYSLVLSAKPRDLEHPYGHGKVEFISAGIEGTLIAVAGLVIIYEAINNFRHPHEIGNLDFGILLVGVAAAVNFGVGYLAVHRGEKNNSLALIASGKHLQSDTYTTLGIIAGLVLMRFTGWAWVDSVVALIFAFVIIYTGVKIVRSSIAGIMDEADSELLDKVVATLNEHREANWVDVHNLRIIKYGSVLHLDFHLTVPWFLNVHDAHDEVDKIDGLVKEKFGESVEMFVHMDGCLDFSCQICSNQDCPERQAVFVKKLPWTVDNISSNFKHRLEV